MVTRPQTARWSIRVMLVMLLVVQPPATAQRPPSLDDVVDRLMAYISAYGPRLESIVAEEEYAQWTETTSPAGDGSATVGRRRVIRSDYALVRLGERDTWVAYRDAFEVDGAPVRDREDRLSVLLAAGSAGALRQAAALANESARFNVATHLVTRNVNVPTLVVTLLHPVNRERFRFSRSRAMQAGDRGLWEIEFRERQRPTLVRQQNGRDQPVRGAISVDPQTGEIWETRLTWERGPGGHITVTFGRVSGLDAIVPIRMVEHYRTDSTIIFGEATYTNFRQFRTAVRVVTP